VATSRTTGPPPTADTGGSGKPHRQRPRGSAVSHPTPQDNTSGRGGGTPHYHLRSWPFVAKWLTDRGRLAIYAKVTLARTPAGQPALDIVGVGVIPLTGDPWPPKALAANTAAAALIGRVEGHGPHTAVGVGDSEDEALRNVLAELERWWAAEFGQARLQAVAERLWRNPQNRWLADESEAWRRLVAPPAI
jgi:hypothetical protein